jgi:hypothetical protein
VPPQRSRALKRVDQHAPEDRRSEASKVGRELIRETATLISEQTYRYLAMPRLMREVLHDNEPIIDRLILISDPRLLRRPRIWVKELIKVLSAAMLVEISIEEVDERPHLKITGRWSDVQLAELTLQRTFVLARAQLHMRTVPRIVKRIVARGARYAAHGSAGSFTS